jgi:hypothetical protein
MKTRVLLVIGVLLAALPAMAQQDGSANGGVQPDPHMFGIFPNHATVEDEWDAPPVGTRQKFAMASENTFDPWVYPFIGFVATMNRSFGPGVSGFGKQYAASLADNMTGNFLTSAALPSLLRQDPRYFQLGSGGVWRRAAYAASRIVVTRRDTGGAQFNVSEIGGNMLAASISNTYYPSAERTVTATLSRWGMQILWDTLSNEMKEFWPDIRQKLHHQS